MRSLFLLKHKFITAQTEGESVKTFSLELFAVKQTLSFTASRLEHEKINIFSSE